MGRTNLVDEERRLILRLERDVAARAHLQQALSVADSTIAGDRIELRDLRARIKRTPAKR